MMKVRTIAWLTGAAAATAATAVLVAPGLAASPPKADAAPAAKAAKAAPGKAVAATPAAAKGWHKSWVVEWYDMPSWYGASEGDNVPDVNCPKGAEEPNWKKMFSTTWRSKEEVEALVAPGKFSFGSPLGNRGPTPNMNVYRDPTMNPDPGFNEVQGPWAYGFDLDGNATNGFTEPNTKQKGIDNAIYKVAGCIKEYRGHYHEVGKTTILDGSYYNNDEMRDGRFTILVVVSGEGKDPNNDPNVKVAFYQSRDQITKDAKNEVAWDYSYRVDPDPRFMSVFDASSVNGVITTKKPIDRLNIRAQETRPYFIQDAELMKAQVRITMKPDGTMSTMLGGYRNWKSFYWGWGAGGSTREVVIWADVVGLWYSLERNADFAPDPVTGKNTAISSAYRWDGVPAFIISPEDNKQVTAARVYKGRPEYADASKKSFDLAAQIRVLGGDASFQLEGGAASWPLPPPVATLQAGDPRRPKQTASR